MREAIVIGLAVIGLAFTLSGAVGILRMPDVYSRIQCSSKTMTMGALPVLIALVVGEGPVSSYGGRALLVAALLLIVNPAASHALARAAYKSGVPMWPGAVSDEPRQQPGPAGGSPAGGSPAAGSPAAGEPGK
jgi:multicomponent Na+:H+ antiporter subunit G